MKPQVITYTKKVHLIIDDADNIVDLVDKIKERTPAGYQVTSCCDADDFNEPLNLLKNE